MGGEVDVYKCTQRGKTIFHVARYIDSVMKMGINKECRINEFFSFVQLSQEDWEWEQIK